MVRITGEDRIKLLSAMAVEIFKALPEEHTMDTRSKADAMRAARAVNVAYLILEDATSRTDGRQ